MEREQRQITGILRCAQNDGKQQQIKQQIQIRKIPTSTIRQAHAQVEQRTMAK
jgi:hypothetical protein